ncbi:MAG TPA: glycosyltransferase family 2 protein [Methylophilaceae bacterium]|nr:glycosyltransferase family 2 protein [Methylophilaceae bacterium]
MTVNPTITLLSVVVPVRNEEGNIEPLISEIHAALSGVVQHEIVYVDDGSTDATAQVLLEAKARYPQLRVLHHARSCGQSTAVRSGVKAARGDWIATLDGDGQNDPADIPKLIAGLEEGVVMVGGNRRHARRDSWIKRVSSVIANGVRSRLLKDSTPDTGCGLKLIRRDVFLDLPYFDHMHRFLPALVLRSGGKIRSIPVNHRPRERGKSNYGTIDRLLVGIVDLFGVAWLLRRAKQPQVRED